MLGQKLKELREGKGLVQRQVASRLDVDTAYISKIEGNEKPLNRQHLRTLATLYDISERELLTLWLADKVYDIVKGEAVAGRSLQMVQREIKSVEQPGKKSSRKK